ncbi:hypothetical protein KP509_32G008500 [Ceratopteris richardii]|uniref:J domain-containing protein n=1 Tax=Ceratopteris richardii TaxID=49495 RepID=A0A8T2QR74_CERRI|nr:hypothetical protein KP509_32G008500 [Ceratopteris richardii]KAH7286467.1 hypothetical protein KP509_32G008500 [Ceratopteris richardii]
MDCNKEDAIKARQIAESKLAAKDYYAAKRFILKSQRLFPSLCGLNQMLAVADIHISHLEFGDDLEFNWHHILKVEEGADEEIIRKQYRKLLLMLHPDKNKYAGAESAFKLVQGAHQAFETYKEISNATADVDSDHCFWTVCSECKISCKQPTSAEYQYVLCPKCTRSFVAVRSSQSKEEVSQSRNKRENSSDVRKAEEKMNNADYKLGGTSTKETEVELSSSSSSSYEEFVRIKRRRNAPSPKKSQMLRSLSLSSSSMSSSLSRDIGKKWGTKPKVAVSFSSMWSKEHWEQKQMCCRQSITKTDVLEEKNQSQATSRRDSPHATRSSPVADVEIDLSSGDSLDNCFKNSIGENMGEDHSRHSEDVHTAETRQGITNETPCKEDADAPVGDCSYSMKYVNIKDKDEMKRDFISHQKMELKTDTGENEMYKFYIGGCSHQPIKDRNAEGGRKIYQDVDVQKANCKQHQKNGTAKDTKKDCDPNVKFFEKLTSIIMNQVSDGDFQVREVILKKSPQPLQDKEDRAGSSSKVYHMNVAIAYAFTGSNGCALTSEDCMVGCSEIYQEDQVSVQCEVPDNDVYNFDKGRQEECFEAGQIWAVYDDDDGLPRFYAYIDQVISLHPFRVRMKWLYPAKPIPEDVKAWTKAGFAYTCGEFILGRSSTRQKVLMFSHIMAHENGGIPCTIRIYPQKGDVWALYKDWKPQKGRTRHCEPVQVISHYSKDQGVEVVPLFKVDGYKSIYCRRGFEGLQTILPSELKRFSHQVPAHYLEGHELSGLPEESVDLDTAALI